MKTKLSALLLCVLLLAAAFPAEAAAGDADDPLISQSYIGDSFLPQVFSAMAQLREKLTSDFAEKQSAVPSGWKTLQLSAGDTLQLGPGQQLVLLSGSVRLRWKRAPCSTSRRGAAPSAATPASATATSSAAILR